MTALITDGAALAEAPAAPMSLEGSDGGRSGG
jgi:hypothetical protein